MRKGRIVVAAAVDDGEFAVLIKALEADHAAVETEVVVDGADALLGEADFGAVLVIGIVAVGDQGVEAVVAPGELEDDEDLAVGFGVGCQGGRGAAEDSDAECSAGGHAEAGDAGAENVSTTEFHGSLLTYPLNLIDTRAGS